MIHVILVLILCLCAGFQVEASTTYYVNQATGKETNNGSQAYPFAKIGGKVLSVLRPGDMVLISNGTYREAVYPYTSGVTFRAAPGQVPVLTGMDVMTGWTRYSGNIYRRTAPWTRSFTSNPPGQKVGRCEQVAVNGTLLKQAFSLSGMPANSFMADTSRRVLYVNLGGVNPATCTVEAATRSVCFAPGPGTLDDITLDGLTVKFCANPAQFGAINAYGDGWTLKNLTISHTNGSGYVVQGSFATVTNVISNYNGQQGAGVNADHFTFSDCEFNGNNTKGYDKNWEAGAVKFCENFDNGQSGGTLTGCDFSYNNGTGFWTDGACDGITCVDCTANGNARFGFMVEISTNCSLIGCTANNNCTDEQENIAGGIFISCSQGCTVQGCTANGNPTGISLWNETRDDAPGIVFGGHTLTGNTQKDNSLACLYYGSPNVNLPPGLTINGNVYGLHYGALTIWDTNAGYDRYATLSAWLASPQARHYGADTKSVVVP